MTESNNGNPIKLGKNKKKFSVVHIIVGLIIVLVLFILFVFFKLFSPNSNNQVFQSSLGFIQSSLSDKGYGVVYAENGKW